MSGGGVGVDCFLVIMVLLVLMLADKMIVLVVFFVLICWMIDVVGDAGVMI